MKKYLALFLAFAVSMAIVSAASAQMKFKDVPDDHWAASAVYDLVKLGVTNGYPDGTFRGTKQITRYETAVFLSKLAKAVGTEDLKADIVALRNEVAALKSDKKGGMPITGAYMVDWRFANLLAEKGSVRGATATYRLKLSSSHDLGEGSNVKVNLDTMDYGYYDDGTTVTGGILATQLLDVESNLSLDMAAIGLENPVALKLTAGPGPKQHAADPGQTLPSDVGVTFVRPRTGVMANTALWGMDVAGGYVALNHPVSGRVQTSMISGSVGYAFEGVPLLNSLNVMATGNYVSAGQFSSDTRDLRANIALTAPLGEKVMAGGTMGMGGSEQKHWMVSGELALNDVWDTGTVAVVRAAKVGSAYIDSRFAAEEFDFAGYDAFMRPLSNASVNLDGELAQTVSEDIRLVGRGSVRLSSDYKYEAPNGRLTAEGGISYAIAPNTTLDALYRLHHSKATSDTTDVAALGLMYKF